MESIRNPNNQHLLTATRAWYSVGPGVLTRVNNEASPEEKITVFPSHMFLPKHHTGLSYKGHEQIYAYQFWGTNDRSYGSVDKMVVPQEFIQPPERWVSVIVTSFNTLPDYVFECLQSIQRQTGYFGIELVWVNDGSNEENTDALKYYLSVFKETSRFIRYKYLENPENWGCRRSLRKAVENCSYDLIFKMDADDIMMPQRLTLQMKFMDENPDTPVCGGQMTFYQDEQNNQTTQHPTEILWNDFVQAKQKPTWLMNHPTICYRKKHLLDIGNYPDTPLSKEHPEQNMMDDYELELKFLKKYGRLCNLPDTLLKYRVHSEQMTKKFPDTDEKMIAWREKIIQQVLNPVVNDLPLDTGIIYEIREPTIHENIVYEIEETKITTDTVVSVQPVLPPVKSQPERIINIDSEPSFLRICNTKSPTSSAFISDNGNCFHTLEKCEGVTTGVYLPSHCVYI